VDFHEVKIQKVKGLDALEILKVDFHEVKIQKVKGFDALEILFMYSLSTKVCKIMIKLQYRRRRN